RAQALDPRPATPESRSPRRSWRVDWRFDDQRKSTTWRRACAHPPTPRRGAFGQPGESTAWCRTATHAAAVVDDLHPDVPIDRAPAAGARPSSAVSHYICNSSANGPCQQRVDGRWQNTRRLLNANANSRGAQNFAGGSEFRAECWLAITRHGVAHLTQ